MMNPQAMTIHFFFIFLTEQCISLNRDMKIPTDQIILRVGDPWVKRKLMFTCNSLIFRRLRFFFDGGEG